MNNNKTNDNQHSKVLGKQDEEQQLDDNNKKNSREYNF